MKPRNALVAFAFLPVALFAAWLLFLRSPMPHIDTAAAEQLADAADGWSPRWASRDVPESEWPAVVKRLRPKSVRVTPDGTFIVRARNEAGERGVFVHSLASSTQPTTDGNPSYRLLRDRVYWYELKG